MALTGWPTGVPGTPTVSIIDLAFVPKILQVTVGTTVTWRHNGQQPHTVTTEDGTPAPIDSGLLNNGDEYSFTFTMPGTYRYFCEVHPTIMKDVQVVVSP